MAFADSATLCKICRNLNIRLETFIETGWRYPTSLEYQDMNDVLSHDHYNGIKHYESEERLEVEGEYSNERLNTKIHSSLRSNTFDENGQLTSLIPAKRQVLGLLDDIRKRSVNCLLCSLVCFCVDGNIYRSPHSRPDSLKKEPSGVDRCRISFDFDGQGSGNAATGLLKLDNTLQYGRYDCRISVGEYEFNLYPQIDQPEMFWFGARHYKERIDLQLARHWLRTCEGSHTRCGPQSWHALLQNITNLRFIDVDNECLVDSQRGENFVALSYVWGSVSMFKSTLSTKKKLYEKNGLKNVWREISLTIRDAMQVTRELGEKFLWTDAICIIQDDPVEKEYLVSNMDAIYAGAHLTIVAADGADANSGLPGVRAGTRQAPKVFNESNGLRLTPFKATIFECLLDCPWSTRGWTYQEALLSSRILVFTSDAMHFGCNTTTWSENLRQLSENSAPPWEFVTAPLFEFGAQMTTILAPSTTSLVNSEDSQENFWWLWIDIMQSMSERKLTYEHDILYATAGLINLLEKSMQTKSMYGLPATQLEKSLFWSPIEPGNLRRRKDKDGNIFGPSWTWAGWVGEISWMAGDIESVELSSEQIKWRTLEHTGESPILVEDWVKSTNNNIVFPYLSLDARVTRFRISRKKSPPEWIQDLHPYAWNRVSPKGTERVGVYCISQAVGKGELVGSVVLDSEDYLAGFDEKVTDFVIVGSTSFRQDIGDFADQLFQHVLAVECKGDVAVRVGHGRILTKHFDASSWQHRHLILG